eukprot:1625252-Rhodomonas_salina.1
MTSEYNEWYKITWKNPKPELEATLNQEWYSAGHSKASTSSHSHSISYSLQFPPPPLAKTRGAGVRVSSSGAGVLHRPNLNGRYEITKAWIEADLEYEQRNHYQHWNNVLGLVLWLVPMSSLFNSIPWVTARVDSETIEKFKYAGLLALAALGDLHP